MNTVTHPIPPVFDSASRILILGSFPSVKSREGHFFYHHPQNRFWKTLAGILAVPVPGSIDEKKEFLLSHHIALWDVIASCSIEGSSDSSIHGSCPQPTSGRSSATERHPGITTENIRNPQPASRQSPCHPQVRRMRRGRWRN